MDIMQTEIKQDKTQGTQTISFGPKLLKRLKSLSNKLTNGNISELVRAICDDGIDRINRDEMEVAKSEVKLVSKND